jgi:hypothetical protein
MAYLILNEIERENMIEYIINYIGNATEDQVEYYWNLDDEALFITFNQLRHIELKEHLPWIV